MTENTEIIKSIYGNQSGYFAFFESRIGLIPPSTLNCYDGERMQELVFIGPTYDFFTLLNRKYSRREITGFIGMPTRNINNISRYMNAESEPKLNPEQWKELMIAFFQGHKMTQRLA